jgi:hypothetical protein
MKKKPNKKHWQVFEHNGQKCLKPFCEESEKKIDGYKVNQVLHGNVAGETDHRSVSQLRLYWQAMKFASERIDDPDWSTKDHVDFQLRMALKFFDLDFIHYSEVSRQVSFKLLSISFANLPHILACNYFDNAFELLANKIPYDGLYQVDVMIEDIKNSCKGSR